MAFKTLTGDVYVVINAAELAAFIRDGHGPVIRYLIVQGEKVKIAAITQAPKETGNLANHIVKRVVVIDGLPEVIVGVDGSTVPYAYWVHEGAPPHVIYPRRAERLVFFSQKAGKVIYMPVGAPVHHPGNRPNRFLVRALNVLNA